MRTDWQNISLIEDYLGGKLSGQALEDFEKELAESSSLLSDLMEHQRLLVSLNEYSEALKIKKLIEPAKQTKTLVPAVTETVTKSILDKPEREEWKEVLCENNTTPEVMAEIERALKAAGFDSGNTDDKKADSKTFSALNDYQKSKGLPVDIDKVINMDTVNSLGIKVKK